jgi:hypothetical protein
MDDSIKKLGAIGMSRGTGTQRTDLYKKFSIFMLYGYTLINTHACYTSSIVENLQ